MLDREINTALPWQKEPSDIFVKIELCIGGDSLYQDAHIKLKVNHQNVLISQ